MVRRKVTKKKKKKELFYFFQGTDKAQAENAVHWNLEVDILVAEI